MSNEVKPGDRFERIAEFPCCDSGAKTGDIRTVVGHHSIDSTFMDLFEPLSPAPPQQGAAKCLCGETKGHFVTAACTPAAPAGTPAKVEPPRCESEEGHADGCKGAPVFKRIVGRPGEAMWLSDACYLAGEEWVASRRHSPATAPPLPRDHWRPAIEALGGVRPFGRPRGQR